ncbi:unnamed protein product [marine sediment metagenome]|uniref:4Fe4S-binding SPASM domain-containing protein n=1 Tax=marine sediment metagenome TaxID=412755 RepID=X1RFY4_9ZZZZ
MRWQFIAFGHNEHEVFDAKRLSKELNMEFRIKPNVIPSYSPIKNKKLIREELGFATIEEFKIRHEHSYLFACKQLWADPQINWDGKLLGCCNNVWGDFGNVFASGLDKCRKSERYLYAKQMLLGEKPSRKDIPCFFCEVYNEMKSQKNFIELGIFKGLIFKIKGF